MKILVIGGSGFIGPFIVRELVKQGHEVAVLHRGNAKFVPPGTVQRILSDRKNLGAHRKKFEQLAADAVIDMILSDERQAKDLMENFRGVTARVVALSSQDVYRAYGVLLGSEPGPPQPIPLTEESEVRTKLHPYKPEQMRMVRTAFSWITDDYDKIPVERTVLNDPQLTGTVVRLPMVYGPGDPLHRLFPAIKRIADGRPAILLEAKYGSLRLPRGYVENVAAAVVLAATSPKAAGRIYNIAMQEHFSELAWAQKIGQAMGWKGAVISVPQDQAPAHIQTSMNTDQDWVVSSDRIRNELGFVDPVPLDVALARTIRWERANPPAVNPAQFDYAAEDALLEQLRSQGAGSEMI
jgi:nucleoside-diphosphate-sugar epimerase